MNRLVDKNIKPASNRAVSSSGNREDTGSKTAAEKRSYHYRRHDHSSSTPYRYHAYCSTSAAVNTNSNVYFT